MDSPSNVNYLRDAREAAGMSRAEVCDASGGRITEDRLRRLETDQVVQVDPADILTLAGVYGAPELIRHFCVRECPIGRELNGQTDEISSNISHIVLNIIASVTILQEKRERLVRIFRDQKLSPEEEGEFALMMDEMRKLKLQIEALQLWSITKQR